MLVLLLTADWDQLGTVFLDPAVLVAMWPAIITTALKNTLLYTVCAFAFGLVLGLLLAHSRGSRRLARTAGSQPASSSSSAASRRSSCSSPSASACRSPSRAGSRAGSSARSPWRSGSWVCSVHGRDHPRRDPGRAQGQMEAAALVEHVLAER